MSKLKHGYRNLTAYRMLHASKSSPFFEEQAYSFDRDSFSCEAPSDWSVSVDLTWRYLAPPNSLIPDQGWKIHLSSAPSCAQRMLDHVSNYLIELEIAFKHLVSWGSYFRLNAKNANRSSSGKFITIYPESTDEFLLLLDGLERLLEGFEGPYILSDVKYRNAPVFFRYGGFRYLVGLNDGNDASLMIRTPDGSLIEDSRKPYFVLPDFVDVPSGIARQVNDRLHDDSGIFGKLLSPFAIEESLHFSNAGGVYLGKDLRSDTCVVAKEARSYAGYSSFVDDAICRLRNERSVLIKLQDLEFVPRYLSYKTICGHEYLFEERKQGCTLQSWVATRYPFSLEKKKVLRYSEDALTIARRIIASIKAIHRNGIALMDVNPKNFIISDDLSVGVVDFEAACEIDGTSGKTLGMPGFAPYCRCSNKDRDIFSAVCVLFYAFWPSWSTSFSPLSLRSRMCLIAEHFPRVVVDFLGNCISEINPRLLESPFGLSPLGVGCYKAEDILSRLAKGVELARRPNAPGGRLYPGDATQFLHGRLGKLDIETGAAGVLLMLKRFGVDVSRDAGWLASELIETKEPVRFHGLLRGAIGVACVLSQIGAYDCLARILPAQLPDVIASDVSIRTGIAGTVLALLQIDSDLSSDTTKALINEAALKLEGAIQLNPELVSPGSETGNPVGLFDGWSGAAVACHELAAYYPEESDRWHENACICADREVSGLRQGKDGSLYVDYSGINFGYLSEGAAGVAFALALCDRERYSDEVEKICVALKEFNSLNGGLFHGLAGKAATLIYLDGEKERDAISTMTRNVIGEFCFQKQDSGFWSPVWSLGNGGSCLSVDYSTGSAGLMGLLLSKVNQPFMWFPVSLH